MYYSFFIHSSVNGHVGCFHVLVIAIVLQWTLGYICLFQFWSPQDIWLEVGLLGHMVLLFLVFKGISILSSIVMDMSLSRLWELVLDREAGSPGGHKSRTWVSDWTDWMIPSSIVAVSIPSTVQEHSLFSTSPAFMVCRLFDDGHSDQCEVISHCNFDLHFSNNERRWASFHVFVSHLCLGLFPTFWLGCLFFWHWIICSVQFSLVA